ncbi:MAG TPA: CAP domain-containing protein, partial [Acidimicrobiia bacterium]|nr:CAP domain-containing protein [Acidimicrobiia bacterium]
MRRFLVVLAVVVMGSLVPLARPASASSNLEAEFVALMNQERATRGLVTLATSGDLVNYGRTHSGSMASRNVLEHSTQLRTLTNWDMLGENVGRGGSVRALHDAFMNSPAHRDNILRSNYRETGVGVVVSGDTIWVTVVFRDPTVVVSTPPPAPTAAPNGVVGIVPTSTGKGYWLARTDGSVSRFGDAASLGSAKGKTSAPVVAMAATPTNKGYWLLDAAGGVFSFGDARYHGSVPGLRQAGHAIGQAEIRNIASTASGRGYWITDAAGGIFSFGDATFYGSIP